MNINDFDAPDFTPEWLKDIFERQTGLIEKYKDIEKMPDWPLTINSREGQKWIKDFLWRVSEELGESYEALEFASKAGDDDEKLEAHHVHQIEELIDALHFLVELVLLVGKDWKWAREQLDREDKLPSISSAEGAYWQVSYYLGMIGNTLKNKPWKQTEMPTDEEKFFLNLGNSFRALFNCLAYVGADEKTAYNYYCRKHQVNQFRQRSAY